MAELLTEAAVATPEASLGQVAHDAAPAETSADVDEAPKKKRERHESTEQRRRRNLRGQLKKATSEAERAEIRQHFLSKYNIVDEDAPAPKATKVSAAVAEDLATIDPDAPPLKPWEDPERRGWPRQELIDGHRPLIAGVLQQIAPITEGTRFDLSPREIQKSDGTSQRFEPQTALCDALAACAAKWFPGGAASSPEGALVGVLFQCWGMPILMESVLTKLLAAQQARAAAAASEERTAAQLAQVRQIGKGA